jgi:cytochrome c553
LYRKLAEHTVRCRTDAVGKKPLTCKTVEVFLSFPHCNRSFMTLRSDLSSFLKGPPNNSRGAYCFVCVVLAFSVTSRASPSLPAPNVLYAPCVSCHQANAWGSADGVIPSLAAQQPRYLEKRLAVFRFDARGDMVAQTVPEHSKWSSQRDSAALAAYLSVLEASPSPAMGSGERLRVGQEIYSHICAACHGDAGLGESRLAIPRLAGQNYPYLRRQIDEAAELHGDGAPTEMTGALRGMQPADKTALADYISRLGVAGALLNSSTLEGSVSPSPRR